MLTRGSDSVVAGCLLALAVELVFLAAGTRVGPLVPVLVLVISFELARKRWV